MTGKRIRIGRLTERRTGNMLIVPMDHGVTMGPLDGLGDIGDTIRKVSEGGATAVLLQKGMLRYGAFDGLGLIMHLSASTGLGGGGKVLVSTVEEALRQGCDAVSVHITFGGDDEGRMLSDLGRISGECTEYGMPLMAMAYHSDPSKLYDADTVAHCSRAVAELGADIVKIPYTGDAGSFGRVVDGTPAPVVIAGGPRTGSDMDVLRMVEGSMEAGGRGVSMGRNIFQHHDVRGMTQAVRRMIVDGIPADEAYKDIMT